MKKLPKNQLSLHLPLHLSLHLPLYQPFPQKVTKVNEIMDLLDEISAEVDKLPDVQEGAGPKEPAVVAPVVTPTVAPTVAIDTPTISIGGKQFVLDTGSLQ